MLCPGLRLAAYLAVQAKHPATQEVWGQRKQKISTEYFPFKLTSQTYCKAIQLINGGHSTYLIWRGNSSGKILQCAAISDSQFKWKRQRYLPDGVQGRWSPISKESERGISRLLSGGRQYKILNWEAGWVKTTEVSISRLLSGGRRY